MTPSQLHAWYEDHLDACNRHDLAAIREQVHPAVRRSGRATGADAWIADLVDLFAGFPDLQWKRIQVVAEGDRVAAHVRVRGTHRGAWQGLAPTGRRVNVAAFGFYRLDAGRVAEYAGDAGLERALFAV